MRHIKQTILSTFVALAMLFTTNVLADGVSNSVVGAGGYDLVSYHTGKKPLPGNGNYVVTVDNVNYLFINKNNVSIFKKNKAKYLPQYGGFCAYGTVFGKKFIGDPNVWEVVDGKLYFNLDNGIKAKWVKDIPGYIVKADEKWGKIKDIKASAL